jgi:hypothetical protein
MQTEQLRKLVYSVSESVARRAKRFANREIKLYLENSIQFYRFYPDRSAAYFTNISIKESNDALTDVASSPVEDYLRLGAVVSRMRRAYLYIVKLGGADEK